VDSIHTEGSLAVTSEASLCDWLHHDTFAPLYSQTCCSLSFPLCTLNGTKAEFQLLLIMSNKLQLIFPGDIPFLCGDEEEL